MTTGRAHVAAALSDEGASYDAGDSVGARQYPAGNAAVLVELLAGDDVLVRGDLEHAVG